MKRMNLRVLLVLSFVLLVATVAFAEHPKALYPGGAVPLGPYSPGIKSGNLVFVSGQISTNQDITAATQEVMGKILAILREARMDFDNVVMTTVYLKNLATDFTPFNIEYGKFFGCVYDPNSTPVWICDPHHPPPARATIQAGAIPGTSLLEVSVIATR